MPESNVWETCPICGALTSNADLHMQWHADLDEAAQQPATTTDPTPALSVHVTAPSRRRS